MIPNPRIVWMLAAWLRSQQAMLDAFILTPKVQDMMRRGAEELFYGERCERGDFSGLAARYGADPQATG